jgi:protein TonB
VAHLSGTVVLRAIISKEGTIQQLSVASTTNQMFNNAALDAVRQWRYKPYLLNGEPTEVDTTITVNFTLNGG